MRWFRDLKIRTKIITSFSVIAILTALVGYQAIRETAHFSYLAEKLPQKDLVGLSLIRDSSIDLMRVENTEKNLLLSRDAEERRKYREKIDKDMSVFLSDLAGAKNAASSEREKDILEKIEKQQENANRQLRIW